MCYYKLYVECVWSTKGNNAQNASNSGGIMTVINSGKGIVPKNASNRVRKVRAVANHVRRVAKGNNASASGQ